MNASVALVQAVRLELWRPLEDELRSSRMQFMVVTSASWFLVAIFGWVAEQERSRLIERTEAGLGRTRRQEPGAGFTRLRGA
jgi:hypothetical protein